MADGSKTNLPRGPGRVWKAAGWSWQGLQAAWRHESSFRLEVCLLMILLPLGLWLGDTPVERVLLAACLLPVLAMELANSAIEALIERYGPQWHPLAGMAKDMGSAAVMLLMFNVVLCWAVILVPRLA